MPPANTIFNLQVTAQELLTEGLRIPLVRAMTGISSLKLSAVRKLVKKNDDIPTRTATNVFSYLSQKSTNPQSLIYLSTFVILYLHLEKLKPRLHKAELFLTAWKSRVFFIEGPGDIDINAAWYAIQGTKAKEVLWGCCKCCSATFIYKKKATERQACPFCHCEKVEIVDP